MGPVKPSVLKPENSWKAQLTPSMHEELQKMQHRKDDHLQALAKAKSVAKTSSSSICDLDLGQNDDSDFEQAQKDSSESGSDPEMQENEKANEEKANCSDPTSSSHWKRNSAWKRASLAELWETSSKRELERKKLKKTERKEAKKDD